MTHNNFENQNQISLTVNNNSQNSIQNPLTIMDNPANLTVPENPKECPGYIAVCNGILKTAGDMLKQLNKQNEEYNALMKLSWHYAVLRLKAQCNLGKYFSNIEGSQGVASEKTKEQILKEEYGISVKKGWQHEQLYKHKDLMDKTLKRAKEDDDLPTLKLALKVLDEENKKASEEAKENQKNKEKHDKNQEKLKENAIKDAIKFQKLHRTEAITLEDDTFNVIYADPTSVNVPMSSLKDIGIPSSKNAVLLLWTESKTLLEALDVIKSWGFIYKDMCVWNHIAASQTGLFAKSQHTTLLFAIKGEGLKVDDKSLESSVLSLHTNQREDVTAYYHDMLETMFPDGAFLDLCDNKPYNSKWKTLSEISNQQSTSDKGE